MLNFSTEGVSVSGHARAGVAPNPFPAGSQGRAPGAVPQSQADGRKCKVGCFRESCCYCKVYIHTCDCERALSPNTLNFTPLPSLLSSYTTASEPYVFAIPIA